MAEDFGHLLARSGGEEAVMQPVARERRAAMGADALGDLVLVVWEDEVEPAAMDVEGLAEMRLGHRRAFDVPTRPAAPPPLVLPGAVPPRQRRRRRLPQHEVASIALVGRHLDARALALLVEVLAREPAVIRHRGDREEDMALRLAGEAARAQRREHPDPARNRLGGARHE